MVEGNQPRTKKEVKFPVAMLLSSSETQTNNRYAHHRKAFRAVLNEMNALGFSAEQCLSGTGLTEADIAGSNLHLTLPQEYTFYRNIIALRRSPTVGLPLGELFRFETYGLLGYALLSSSTVAEAIQTTVDFAPLTFSHFKISKVEYDDLYGTAFRPMGQIPSDLFQFYCDRDLSAAVTGMLSLVPDGVSLTRVALAHSYTHYRAVYEDYFKCDVVFSNDRNELLIGKQHVQIPLPRRDREASAFCKEQCEALLARLDQTDINIVEQVRAELISRPGDFPTCDDVADRLKIGVRTLRRSLSSAGTSYQQLLQSIRLELAEDYLQSNMSLDTVAHRLGYSEASTFSHAFKRWCGVSPREYRKTLDDS